MTKQAALKCSEKLNQSGLHSRTFCDRSRMTAKKYWCVSWIDTLGIERKTAQSNVVTTFLNQ